MTTHGQHDSTQAMRDRPTRRLQQTAASHWMAYLLNPRTSWMPSPNSSAKGKLSIAIRTHWMLAQVDFIIETIGDVSLELSDEVRSDLLQLLLRSPI